MREAEKYIYENWDNVIRENKQDEDTLIGLPFPYTVPCMDEMFQELYYWDTYFTNIGLILSGRTDIAKNNTDDMLYLVDKFGFMPNGNRTFYQYRSQPPFLSEMVKDIYGQTGDRVWLKDAYTSLEKEYKFWQNDRMTDTGLNRYYGQIKDFSEFAYNLCHRIGAPYAETDEEKQRLGESLYSICESGWDCNSRFLMYAQDIIPVDLNSLLYGMEKNMAEFSRILGTGDENIWISRAETRKKLMNDILWDEKIGAFCDYDFKNKEKRTLVSTAMFYPVFFGLTDKVQTEKAVKLLEKLEFKFGVSSSENRDDLLRLQWDYPNGWPCQQYLVVKALLDNGFKTDALRIAEKYVDLVEKTFSETGNLWEKYDVTDGTVSVTKEYKTPAMMGWTAGIYLYCLNLIK